MTREDEAMAQCDMLKEEGIAFLEKTPYEKHCELGHKTVWSSPDGFVKIEECTECFERFLHDPTVGYPVSMRPSKWQLENVGTGEVAC